MSTGLPDHHCPGCGTALTAFLRYPWHFCKDCRNRVVDFAGRPLAFGNASLSGGFEVGYAGEARSVTCRGCYALIDGRPVHVTEARFGGIVAQPVRSELIAKKGELDFRRRLPPEFA